MNNSTFSAVFMDIAVNLASLGIAVFPCIPGGKKPLTPNGFKNASTDIAQVTKWWRRYPDANIGIATGAVSGLYVIDIDNKDGKDGSKNLGELEGKHGKFPGTYTVRTPSGGFHYYFTWLDGLGNSAERLGPGIDTRGEGGYVIGAGSVIGGRAYEVIVDLPPAELPMWMLELLNKPKAGLKKSNVRRSSPSSKPESVSKCSKQEIRYGELSPEELDMPTGFRTILDAKHPVGTRSEAFFKAVHGLYDFGASLECIKELLLHNPSLSEKYENRLEEEIARCLLHTDDRNPNYIRILPPNPVVSVGLEDL